MANVLYQLGDVIAKVPAGRYNMADVLCQLA